ncbi:MAG: hypothetical protein U5O39_07740 [Gammaproteobacteria bacterium]|nr:hypothetical protein [Gammaproteobacteria bacterium]
MMKRILIFIAVAACLPIAAAAPDASDPAESTAKETPASDTTASSNQSTDESDDAQPEASADDATTARPSEGGLRDTVQKTMRTFTPSQAIDVDKPVDFPTNI